MARKDIILQALQQFGPPNHELAQWCLDAEEAQQQTTSRLPAGDIRRPKRTPKIVSQPTGLSLPGSAPAQPGLKTASTPSNKKKGLK